MGHGKGWAEAFGCFWEAWPGPPTCFLLPTPFSRAVLQNADTILNDDGTTSFVPNENIYLAALVVAILLLIVLAVEFKMLKKKEASDHE